MEKLFGTDGIRGVPGEYPLTDGMLFKIGRGVANFLLHNRKDGVNHRPKVIIGEDTRISCCKLETILTGGMTSCGVDVVSCGTVPTPGLAFLTHKLKADMGMMISASHNRPEDNGIKLFSESGYKLSEGEEEWIEKIVYSSLVNFDEVTTQQVGSVSQVKHAQKDYIDFLMSTVPSLNLKGLKIVLDCSNGAVSSYAPVLFRQMNAEVFSIGDKPNGMNINVGHGVLHPENMAGLVKKYNADIGFAFDGDGDRLIFADEKGNILDGDYIMAIIGINLIKKNRLPKKTIAATVMSNFGFEQAINDAGGRVIRTVVGDKYVLEAMRRQSLALGGEQSGHIIMLKHSTTGDALVAALQLLKIMNKCDKRLSELSQCMRKFPQVLINVKVKQKESFDSMPSVSQAISESNERLKGVGRILVRYSGTEPLARVMVEGKDDVLIKEIANRVADTIENDLGLDS